MTDEQLDARIKALIEKEIQAAITKYRHPIKIFSLNSCKDYAGRVAEHLSLGLTPTEEKLHTNGEPYIKPSSEPCGNVRGHNCFVVARLDDERDEDVSTKFTKFTLLCSALAGAHAHQVVGVLAHAFMNRQGKKVQSRDVLGTLSVHSQMVAAGMDHALYVEVHDLPATQNSFPIRNQPDNLEVRRLFAEWAVVELKKASGYRPEDTDFILRKKVKVLAPDAGAYVRCVHFADTMSVLLGLPEDEFIDVVALPKVRKKGGKQDKRRKVTLMGDVRDCWVLTYDDMMDTFGTMETADRQVEAEGGEMFALMAAHGIFGEPANERVTNLNSSVRLVVADTVKPWRLNEANQARLHVIDTTRLVADAIWRIHSTTGSISELL